MRGSARGWRHRFRAEIQNNRSILGVETKPQGETAAAAAAFTSEPAPTDQLLTLRSGTVERCIGARINAASWLFNLLGVWSVYR